MAYKLVIFDLDGTLINTIGDLGAAVNHSMENAGFPTHSEKEYKLMVGHGIRNLVTRALPEEAKAQALENGCLETFIDERLAEFKAYYTSHIDVLSRPYDGVHDILRALAKKGIHLAVASNKFHAGTETLIQRFFPDIPFCTVIGNKEGLPLKPDPAVVALCMDSCGVHDFEQVAFVGDSATDIKTAKAAGVASIGVSWGFRGEDELNQAGADHIAREADELLTLLLN